MALNQAPASNISVPEFQIGDKVKLSTSLPGMKGNLIYIHANSEVKYDPPVSFTFNAADGYVFTIYGKQDAPPPARTSMSPTGPDPLNLFEYRLIVHLPTYTRKEYIPDTTISIKTPIPYPAVVLHATGNKSDKMYEIGDVIRLVKDMPLELYGAPLRQFKKGTLFEVTSEAWSTHRGVKTTDATRPEGSKYGCKVVREKDTAGDTYWKSNTYHPVSALTAA